MAKTTYHVASPAGLVKGGQFDPMKSIARYATLYEEILYQANYAGWIVWDVDTGLYIQISEDKAREWLTRHHYNLDTVLFDKQARNGQMTIHLGIQLKTDLHNLAQAQGVKLNKFITNILRGHLDNRIKEELKKDGIDILED